MRVIDADKLYKKCIDLEQQALTALRGCNDSQEEWIRNCLILNERTAFKHDLFDAETIEAEPVKHGYWTNIRISASGTSSADCSLCGAVVNTNFTNRINYCPNCGAKMDEPTQKGVDKALGALYSDNKLVIEDKEE